MADAEDEETASDAATGYETLGAPETFGTDTVLPTDAAPAPEADCTVAAANDAANAASIRAEALTHARAVVDLCRLAGQPQIAGRFLERDTSLNDVRASLLATRAEAVLTFPPPIHNPAARLARAPGAMSSPAPSV